MKDTGQEQHYTTSELARMFDACPTPLLANADLQKRWQCSRSTVDRIRKVHGLTSDGPEGGRGKRRGTRSKYCRPSGMSHGSGRPRTCRNAPWAAPQT